jgi:polyphosphate kinase
MSENIHIYSILGRFLEHSRIFWFQNDGNDEFYIGSADWMYRNLDYRVEAVTPIEDPSLRERLKDILETMLNDHGHSWELQSDGRWLRRINPDNRPASDTHDLLMSRFLRNARKTRHGR